MKKLLFIPMLFACFLGMGQEKSLKDLRNTINADEQAGRMPSLLNLELYANAARMQKDEVYYEEALKKIISYYRVKKYWDPLFNIIQRKPGYNHRLDLDLLRLKFSVGLIITTIDFMEMSQLTLDAGSPAESLKVIEQGFKVGVLGTGAEAGQHNRLRLEAQKKLAELSITLASFESDAENG
jgi:tetratricopeptide (TPR) repeat protein